MYKDNLVVSIQHNGKFLREKGDEVYLPFLSEYSIYLKNIFTRKAVVNVYVDGQDVLDGQSLIINSNEAVNLEGFLQKNKVKNKFRFIEKTKQISEYRGDFPEDGLIKIDFQFEAASFCWNFTFNNNENLWITPQYPQHDTIGFRGTPDVINSYYTSSGGSFTQCCTPTNSVSKGEEVQEIVDGITVPGSRSGQSFIYGTMPCLENEKHTIILKLKGTKHSRSTLIKEPLLTRTKLVCKTCGTKSVSSANFCRNCGTALF